MPYHHHQIQFAQFDAMLPKYIPDDSFDIISVCCTGNDFFGRNNSKPSIFSVIAYKKNFELPVGYVFGMNNMAKSIFTQQSVRGGKIGRYARPRVLHDPWRDVH